MNFTLRFICISLVVIFCEEAYSQQITTIAGGGSSGLGDGGFATSATIFDPHGGVFDKMGNLFFVEAQAQRIRKIGYDSIITTYVGNGTGSYNGDGIAATAAKIYPNSIAIDKLGNLFITDAGNHRIRKVDVGTGLISTIAGTGIAGYNGDNIAATAANINGPWGIVVDKDNNIYFSDVMNYRIRKITADGIIHTIAGNGTIGFSGDGGLAINAKISGVFGICMNSKNELLFADYNGNNRIRKIDISGNISTIAGNGTAIFNGENVIASAAQINPLDIRIDKNENLYFVDFANSRIRKLSKTGIISTVTGTGINGYNGDNIAASTAQIKNPGGLAIDTCGNIYFGDIGNSRIRKITFNPDCLPVEVKNIPMNETGISFYPNPATENVNISAGVSIAHISICNALGQVVLEQQPTGGKKTVAVAVHHLPAGIYMVQVNGLYAGKLLKE